MDKNELTDYHDQLICECYTVGLNELREDFQECGIAKVERWCEVFHLGQGCGNCLKNKDIWLNLILRS